MTETGIVKWFDGKKGYGFITRANGEKDVFVHATDLRKSGIEDEDVDEGDPLSFEIKETERGIKAVKLSRVPSADAAPVAEAASVDGVVPAATIPDPEAG